MAEPSISTLVASETCGTRSRSASMAAITPIRASVDSDPQITRSNPFFFEHLGQRIPGREPIGTGQALDPGGGRPSAPIDSALRIDSAAFSGPMVKIVTSASAPAARCASAIRTLLHGVLVKFVDEPVH